MRFIRDIYNSVRKPNLQSKDIKINPIYLKPLKVLVLSDFHFASEEEFEVLRKQADFDIIFMLGDIKNSYLKTINSYFSKEKFGVIGNHDSYDTLEKNGIINVHGKLTKVNGIDIIGFQGSYKYKNGEYPSFTQEESLLFSKGLPKADVLISHDSPYELYGKNNQSHIGLKGVSDYISKNNIALNIHGHHHINTHKVLKNGTTVVCVFRASIIDLSNYTVKNIF